MVVISLGAGVQSSTMALMAAEGAIGPKPDCAIFADTGAEPGAVYDHLAWLMSGVLPFPVHIVSAGNLRDNIVGLVEQWIGISIDEVSRMKPARKRWQHNRWPLIELRMSRVDCLVHCRLSGPPVACGV